MPTYPTNQESRDCIMQGTSSNIYTPDPKNIGFAQIVKHGESRGAWAFATVLNRKGRRVQGAKTFFLGARAARTAIVNSLAKIECPPIHFDKTQGFADNTIVCFDITKTHVNTRRRNERPSASAWWFYDDWKQALDEIAKLPVFSVTGNAEKPEYGNTEGDILTTKIPEELSVLFPRFNNPKAEGGYTPIDRLAEPGYFLWCHWPDEELVIQIEIGGPTDPRPMTSAIDPDLFRFLNQRREKPMPRQPADIY